MTGPLTASYCLPHSETSFCSSSERLGPGVGVGAVVDLEDEGVELDGRERFPSNERCELRRGREAEVG